MSKNKSWDELEYFDMVKSRVLKYIFYKKRTEDEVRKKFSSVYDENVLDEVIEHLKELGYINDDVYIERAVSEFMALKNLSIKEIKFKLLSKGLNSKTIEAYFDKNDEKLKEYEIKSARNIVNKKSGSMEEIEVKNYLYKKGYREESIREVL